MNSRRWLYAGTLIFLFIIGQFVFAALLFIPIVAGMESPPETQAELMRALTETQFTILTLASAGLAGVVTMVVALAFPALWNRISEDEYPLSDWLAMRKPRYIPLWVVPVLMIIPLGAAAAISLLFGEATVEAQQQLFNVSAPLAIAAALVVTLIAPPAEELVFRGALYNAILPEEKEGWQRHIAPFVVITLIFTVIHLLSGFETFSSIAALTVLSMFLTALRAITGSIWPPMLAHFLSNSLAAFALLVEAGVLNLPPIS